MTPLPPSPDNGRYLLDLPDPKGHCYDPLQGYCPSYQCVVPTPVFDYQSPLFSRDGTGESIGATGDPSESGQSRDDIQRLSNRPYSVRVSDANDFARVWELTVVPIILDILQDHYKGDFSVDVHNFPELSNDSVPRVICITLPVVAPIDLQERVRDELATKVPPTFSQTHLKFRQGAIVRSETGRDNLDPVCEPRNSGFHETPAMGMSVGPHSSTDCGSLGGFVKLRGSLYGMGCRHVFEDAVSDGDMSVVHPAQGDHYTNQTKDSSSGQIAMGSLLRLSRQKSTRESLTFQGTGLPRHNRVEMDWCLFGPVPEGKNMLSVPCFDMNRLVTVETTATIEGNTEVYAIGRTSGYSLGFTSDMPGVQKLEGVVRREWTVRQYCPANWDPATHLDPSWQSVEDWVTSGMGVPGDSGAWLMRRSDNAVIAMIWARNHNHGNPVERVRLTYVTPIVDIFADVNEKGMGSVSLPSYSPTEVQYDSRNVATCGCTAPEIGRPSEPWSLLSMDMLNKQRQDDHSVIASGDLRCKLCARCLRSSRSPDGHQLQTDSSKPRASGSLEVSVNMSNPARSDSPLLRSESNFSRREFLLTIGAAAVFQLGQPGLSLPSLEMDMSSVCSKLSSQIPDEPETPFLGSLPQIDGQDGGEEERDILLGEAPVRSKAAFPLIHMKMTRALTLQPVAA